MPEDEEIPEQDISEGEDEESHHVPGDLLELYVALEAQDAGLL